MSAEVAEEPRFATWAPFAAIATAIAVTIVLVTFLRGVQAVDGSGGDDLSPAGSLVASATQSVVMVLAAVAFARVTVPRVTRGDFGMRRLGLSKELWVVPLGFLVFFGVLQAFGGLVDPDAEDTLPTDLGADDSTVALVGVAVFACLLAPIAEEVVFRGFLFAALRRALGWIAAALVTGGVFGLLHFGTDPVFILPLAVFGAVLCAVYQRTGSLVPGMGLHAFNNGLALGTVLDWSVAGTVASAVLAPVIVVGLAWTVAER